MKKLLSFTVVLFIVTGLAGLAYSGGAPNPTGACRDVYVGVLGGSAPSQGGLPKMQGTTVLGQFIATQQIDSNYVIIQLMISKGNA